jgi:hypothetical protein
MKIVIGREWRKVVMLVVVIITVTNLTPEQAELLKVFLQ